MKRPITATGLLTLVAMILVGVFSTGSASAVSVFLWTGSLPGLVLVLSTNKQVFTSQPGGTPIECEHFGGHAIASNGKAMTTKEITLTGLYTKCLASGSLPATVTPAEFLLNADGSVAILKPLVISISVIECSLKISSSSGGAGPNSNLKTLKYLNEPKAILAHAEIKGITSLSSGGECGPAGEEKKAGEYTGLFLALVHGGTLQWDQ
jgi:hypothetical protein